MKKFLTGLLCLTVIFTLTGCGKNNTKKETIKKDKEKAENVYVEDQQINNLTFEHFAIVKDSNDISILYFDITNNTESSIYVGKVKFTLYIEGAEALTMSETVNEEITPGASKTITENFDSDLTRVDKVEYTVE